MISTLPDYDDHEMVVFLRDRPSGLRAIIAIHDTRLGPAHGGIRAWSYPSEAEAVTDALRLSWGMTLKNAVAGLPLGGGKSVILLEPGQRPSPAMLRAFGRGVEALGGRYIPAEDVGIGPADMTEIAKETAHAFGVPGAAGAAEADPSPYTALGVFRGIEAMLGIATGTPDLTGRHVAVQGLGNVGMNLARLLKEAGASLTVADLDPARVAQAQETLGAATAAPDAVHKTPADVFAPCALGGILNPATIPELGARIVCGAANNQLADDAAGEALEAAGVHYAPDFVVNAGGVMWTSTPITGLSADAVRARLDEIPARLREILAEAKTTGTPPQSAAAAFAVRLIEKGHPREGAVS